MTSASRTPEDMPHVVSIEQDVLGVLLFDNAAYERVGALSADHFHEPFHGWLFAAIEAGIRKGHLVDPMLLDPLCAQGPLTAAYDELGGLRYLADLVERAPPAANVRDYARTVVETARRRQLIRIGGEISLKARAQDIDRTVDDQVTEAEQALYAIAEHAGAQGGFINFSQALTGAMAQAAEAFGRDGGISGLSTGLHDIDQKTGGLHPSDLVVIAGRPSMGKTALATNIAFNVARRYAWQPDGQGGRKTTAGGIVGFFSLEMSAEQLALRILADASGVPSDRVRRGDIDASEFGRLRDAAMELQEAPLYVDATGGITLAKLTARARRMKRQHGLDLIVVDYLQLVTAPEASGPGLRVQEVSAITVGLKALAKELGVPVVALSQLSRQVEQREDKRPMLSDLRESGSIEQDADMVWFVYREAYYVGRTEPQPGTSEHLQWEDDMEACRNLAEVIIGKQRHGPIGTVRLAFQAETTRFTDLPSVRFSGERP